jgi:hypothetical protein
LLLDCGMALTLLRDPGPTAGSAGRRSGNPVGVPTPGALP